MHCLAVLQRLSLRGRLQSKMIHLGALDVVLKLLELLVARHSSILAAAKVGTQAGGCEQLVPAGPPGPRDARLLD